MILGPITAEDKGRLTDRGRDKMTFAQGCHDGDGLHDLEHWNATVDVASRSAATVSPHSHPSIPDLFPLASAVDGEDEQ